MKLQRLCGALAAAWLTLAPAAATEQASYVTPVSGPMTMAVFAGAYLNPALRAIATCHNGSSAPANGPSGAPLAYQCWVDTTGNPALYKIFDGTSWVTLGSINTSTHAWAPYLTGGTSGGVPYFSASGVLGSSAVLAQNGFVVGGGAGAAPASIAACSDDQVAFGRTSATPLCRTVSGDVTFAAGVSAIGAGKVTSAMLNADVYSTAHTWAGQQTFVAPVLGTPASATLTNATGLPVATGISGLGSGVATWLATASSANLRGALTDETGTGAAVFATSPTLVTPALGTPSSATLTNATGLPVATGISGLGSGVAAWLATASSANLASALTDETGSGAAVFGTGPTLANPVISGASPASSGALGYTGGLVNWYDGTQIRTVVAIDATQTLTNKTLNCANNACTVRIASDVSGLGSGVATWLGTASSANLAAALTDETGTGAAVFATSPTLVTPALGTPSSVTLTNATGLPVATGISGLGSGVAAWLATASSANLASALTDETGSGAAVFGTAPTISAPVITGAADVQQALTLSGDISPAQLTAATHNWAPTGFSTASTIRLSTDASRNITGIAAGADGRVIVLHNVGSQNAVLTNEDANSTAGNRFLFGGDLTLAANASVTLRYDATSSRWRSVASTSAGGGGAGTVTSVTLGAGYGISVSGTNPVTTAGTFTPAVGLSTITSSLGADVLLNNVGNYFDGPSVAQGSTGTWWVSGTATVTDTNTQANINCKLWDGTTVIAASRVLVTSAAITGNFPIALSGYLASPAGNLRISCRDENATTGKILYNGSGTGKDSTISAVRIQ
ncbi:hypothetical protein XI09_42205 [Bradyrhizobium sp. CCBAU 11386]|uniref:beta strand repeat-containing protein n=1 Tax=Bradyrhizobium sp. CCBAU 11386 TaxID=1630837 RepID=UPI002302B015|nr:hypothetical protein [Bradyrhizobium sp. CCBAU 11386]MDA9511157.1 hypothetical protein [Bradyrhizobium sp. CCBAU 11386]